MRFISATIVCLVVHHVLCNANATGVSSSRLVGFIGIGYDILRGNPEGDFNRGGIDPGFKLSRNILKRTYTEGKQAIFEGETIDIPDQMSYHPLSSCSSSQSISVFTGTQSYQNKLDVNVDISAEGSYGLFDFRFSLSEGYSEVTEEVQSQERVILDKTVICNKGNVRYLTSTALNTDYSISDDFYYAVKNLPLSYDESTYIKFIQDWGTHFIESATVGGRLIERYHSSYQELYQYASENVEGSVSASGEYLGYSASFEVDVEKFSEQASHTTEFGSELDTIYSGSKIEEEGSHWKIAEDDSEVPIPIGLELLIITDAFDERLWTVTPDEKTYDELQIEEKLNNLETALAQYPSVAGASTGSDPSLRFPNAWPDGTYTLPKTSSGCPSGGDAFTWREGWIKQDNEDNRNRNKCPSPWRFSGYCNRNLQLYYCTKTVTRNDFGISWPEGSYCIVKKGDCPSGLKKGSIYWDDEDSRNANKRGGILPDGTFNRNTRIYYCCRNDKHPHNEIYLPRDEPFFMIKYHRDGCQEVTGMSVTEYTIKTDDEDRRNRNSVSSPYPYGAKGSNHHVTYCYYD